MSNYCSKSESPLDDNDSKKKIIIIIFALILLTCGIGYFFTKNKDNENISYRSLFNIINERNEYLKENSEVINTLVASTSSTLQSEDGVIRFLNIRGINSNVYYRYSIKGESISVGIASESSDNLYPEYITSYISSNNETWVISVSNGIISATNNDITITENDFLVYYDKDNDAFYSLLPNEDIKNNIYKVDEINSELLDKASKDYLDNNASHISKEYKKAYVTSIKRTISSENYTVIETRSYTYDFDDNGNVTSFNETTNHSGGWPESSYDYSVFINDDGSYAIGDSMNYDKYGNFLFDATPSYDVNGNLISLVGTSENWNYSSIEFKYDESGYLIERIEDGVHTYYSYDSNHTIRTYMHEYYGEIIEYLAPYSTGISMQDEWNLYDPFRDRNCIVLKRAYNWVTAKTPTVETYEYEYLVDGKTITYSDYFE